MSNTDCIPPDPQVVSEGVTETSAFPSLPALAAPIAMVQPENDSNVWFIATRAGRVYTFNDSSSASSSTQVLDISSKVNTTLEMGFTGFAIHPDYPNDARVFALYNDLNNGGRSTLSSFSINTSTRVINAGSETVLLTLNQPANNHNGGDLAFGNDGMLYAAFGDGGSCWPGCDQFFSQDLRNLHGALIRIDIDTAPYGIPADNPFNTGQARCSSTANSSGQNCPEIYAYGLRNPWRFSVDMETGNIWIGDVGEGDREEVNRVSAGANYGWPRFEGTRCTRPDISCNSTGMTFPVTEYPRGDGVSVLGGYVYRGTQSPGLAGKYIFADIYSNRVMAVPADASLGVEPEFLFSANGSSFAMAQGNDGEVYLLKSSGSNGQMVQRITGGGSATVDMPDSLSETGCFNTLSKSSTTGVFDYEGISTLWSDGADKRRSFAIPNNTHISVLADGDFNFPTNSVLIKHFLHNFAYLETRLLVKHSFGWRGYSYEWNDAQTDATLLSDGKTKDVGGYVHIYPSRSQCDVCHTNAANNSLGLEAIQLNRDHSTLNANTFDYLAAAGYLSGTHSSLSYDKLYALDDDDATLEQRARSYLHTNCSSCHRPGGSFPDLDLRYEVPLADTNTCNVAAGVGSLGGAGAMRIAEGNPDLSTVVLRMEATTESGHRMPRLGTNVVDQEAVALIRDWIAGLSCP